jgi:hypothetical protein
MDRRVFIFPVVSIFLILALFLNTDMTGMIVGRGVSSEIKHLSAQVRIAIRENIIPEDSVVTVSLGNQTSSMPLKEFIEKSGEEYELKEGEIPEIGYEGYGYAGEDPFLLDLSEFGLDLDLEAGEYTLVTEISYGNFVISSTAEEIII